LEAGPIQPPQPTPTFLQVSAYKYNSLITFDFLMKISLRRIDDAFNFEAKNEDGRTVLIDAAENIGGRNLGVRPMQMMLMGAAGCAAIDIVSILKKQKQEITGFEIDADGERETPAHTGEAAVFNNVNILFRLTGKIDPEKAKRAVELSMEKYCSASKTLRLAGATIKYNVFINGTSV
jgi:putative redox protein